MTNLRSWQDWPRKQADSETWPVIRRVRGGATKKELSYAGRMLWLAVALSDRNGVGLEDVVVFYPSDLRQNIANAINWSRRHGTGPNLKGLTISSTRHLRKHFVAFLRRDIDAGRTPASRLHVDFHVELTGLGGHRMVRK